MNERQNVPNSAIAIEALQAWGTLEVMRVADEPVRLPAAREPVDGRASWLDQALTNITEVRVDGEDITIVPVDGHQSVVAVKGYADAIRHTGGCELRFAFDHLLDVRFTLFCRSKPRTELGSNVWRFRSIRKLVAQYEDGSESTIFELQMRRGLKGLETLTLQAEEEESNLRLLQAGSSD